MKNTSQVEPALQEKFTSDRSITDVDNFLKKNDDFIVIGSKHLASKVSDSLSSKKIKSVKEVIIIENHSLYEQSHEWSDLLDTKDYLWNHKLILASHHAFEMSKMLLARHELAYLNDYIFFDHLNLLDNPMFHNSIGKPFCDYYDNNKDEYKIAYSNLSDSSSRLTYMKIINSRRKAFHPELIKYDDLPTSIEMQYKYELSAGTYYERLPEQIDQSLREVIAFKLSQDAYSHFDIVSARNKNVILNIGAYNNTSVPFAYNSPNAKIYAFEPLTNMHMANVELSRLYPQIIPINKGAWNQNCTLSFQDNDQTGGNSTASHIAESGNSEIEVISIDDFAVENKLKPDFIKMDVEGSEIEVLNGAKDVISEYLPDLAISIYHDPSHLHLIPNWINDISKKYRIFIGHKYFNFMETVCFAKARKD